LIRLVEIHMLKMNDVTDILCLPIKSGFGVQAGFSLENLPFLHILHYI
jgi:hypothetical protein